MKPVFFKSVMLALFVAIAITSCVQDQEVMDFGDFKMEEISPDDLTNWSFYGLGKAFKSNGQFCITENDSTFGAMIVSPGSYDGDVVVRYKALSLTSATVLVVMLSASDLGASTELTVPGDYNGKMSFWTKEKDNYFFAFRTAPHNNTPFLRKYPVPGSDALATASDNIMVPGIHYEVELGRVDNKLWLTVDGEKIFETVESEILQGGHIAFRARGTANYKAACLIKDLVIYSKQ